MKIGEYAEHIKKLAQDHPELDVVYSIDDEGNAYHKVHYEPSVQEVEVFDMGRKERKVICIN